MTPPTTRSPRAGSSSAHSVVTTTSSSLETARSSPDSIFSSNTSTSTFVTTDSPEPSRGQASMSIAAAAAIPPAFKAATINLPVQLPPSPRPLIDVDCTTLIVDEEIKEAPIGYVLALMHDSGRSLLNAATHTKLEIPADSKLPSYMWAKYNNAPIPDDVDPPTMMQSPPTHVLAIHAPDAGRTLLVPVHGMLFAARSSSLSILSSSPEFQPGFPHHPLLPSTLPPASDDADRRALPVIQLTLPSATVFPLLLTFMYLRSPNVLLSSLLPRPRSDVATPSSSPPVVIELARALSSHPTDQLLHRVSIVHALWQDVVALEISDEHLWATMRFAWAVLIGAMSLRQRAEQLELREVPVEE